ncbi:MAG: hypothetical protein R2909_16635 [Gemmatimonadales bacterium]
MRAARPHAALLLAAAFALGCAEHDQRARGNYLLHCMGCHGENGEGLEGHVPNMRTDLARLVTSPGGRAYVLRVPGVTQSTLEPEALAEVLNYTVREFAGKAVARKVEPFTAADVIAARARPLLEITETRAGLVSDGATAGGQ